MSGMSSGITLADESSSQRELDSASLPSDVQQISSYGTFDAWLESFSSSSVVSGSKNTPEQLLDSFNSSSHVSGSKTTLEQRTSPEPVNNSSDSQIPFHGIELLVYGLPSRNNIPGYTSIEMVKLEGTDFWDEALRLLRERGYEKVCGFKVGDELLNPLRAHTADVSTTVTHEMSTFSLAKGLTININEPLQVYFDSFVRAGEERTVIPDITFEKASDAGKIIVLDYFGDSCKKLEVSFNRTLRVPDDGKVYNLPAIFSPLPLVSTEELEPGKLEHLRKNGSLLVPLYSREALALGFDSQCSTGPSDAISDFAVKIYAGSVNVVTTAAHNRAETDTQDYVLVPPQSRLDGFLVGSGMVKQFVAMPLGSGYSVEDQITGSEDIGGLQMLVTPPFWARGFFPGHPDQKLTPRQMGLQLGAHVLMRGKAVVQRSKQMGDRAPVPFLKQKGLTSHHCAGARPAFVHEVVLRQLNEHTGRALNVEAVLHYKVKVQARPPEEHRSIAGWNDLPADRRYRWDPSVCKEARLSLEYSPFLGISDLATSIAQLQGVELVALFLDDRELRYPNRFEDEPKYIPLHTVISDDAVLYCQGYSRVPDLPHQGQSYGAPSYGAPAAGSMAPPQEPKKESLKWDMGLAPGGKIRQQITKDPFPHDWNWARARLINIQILNSVVFESVSGVRPPPSPMSFQDYIAARLPFYHIIEDEGVAGTSAATGLISVGEQDSRDFTPILPNLTKHHREVGCVICEKNFADSVLHPCNHVFCSVCIRDKMSEGNVARCAACRQVVKEVVNFAAVMQLPTKVQHHDSIEEEKSTLTGVKQWRDQSSNTSSLVPKCSSTENQSV